jgi:hypothetical protein
LARRIKEDDIVIRFRSTKAWTNQLSKAKFFYVYLNKKQLFKGEFRTVKQRVADKASLVYEVLDELFYVEKIKVPKPKKKKEKKVKPLGRVVEEYEKEVYSPRLGIPHITEKIEYQLNRLIPMNTSNINAVKQVLYNDFMDPAINFFKNARGKELMFIFRLMFYRSIKTKKGKIQRIRDGIGTYRVQAKTLQQFINDPFQELFRAIDFHVAKYFAASLNREILIRGFTIENIVKFLG